MNSVLEQQVDALSRLATTIRTGLTQAELAVPPINELLADLAEMGVCNFEYEGPAVYCRPAGPSSAYDDSFVVYQAAIIQPGGIGCVLWDATDYHEHTTPPRGEPVDLAASFIGYDRCPPLVRALLVAHAGRLLERFMGDVRLLGS